MGWVVGGEDESLRGYCNRAAFDLSDEVAPVGPAEDVAEAEVPGADVIEEDDLFAFVAVPPDGAVTRADWFETRPEVVSPPRFATPSRPPPVEDFLGADPGPTVSRSDKALKACKS